MSNLIQATPSTTAQRHAQPQTFNLSKLALRIMLIAISAAFPFCALADNATSPKTTVVKKQDTPARTDRTKARALIFQAAVEELRRNPHAADLPECSNMQTASTAVCIRKPADIAGRNG